MPSPLILGGSILGTATKYLVDNLRAVKEVKRGSIIYCGLMNNQFEHSGVYIGDNKIVHLDGSGLIEVVSPEIFLNRLGGLNMALSIYVSCKDGQSVGSEKVAQRAKEKIGKKVEYSVISNNCHMFSSGCLTGNFENNDWPFWLLKNTASSILGCNEWRVWDFRN
ncbi:MAG: lecithin retinol acyltransferase family protein [Acinetobacter sp.]